MPMLSINLDKLITPDHKFEQRKQAHVEAIKKAGNDLMQQGFPFETPEHGPQHLQSRNDTDKTNWLTSQAAYKAQIEAGNGEVAGAQFRTAENNTITRTFTEGYALILQMAAWGQALYKASWDKQDAARAATNDAELEAVSLTEGWAS